MTTTWINTTDELPPLDELVWLLNKTDNSIMIGCRVLLDEEEHRKWYWAELDGPLYIEANTIVGDCVMDDITVTHWAKLPRIFN